MSRILITGASGGLGAALAAAYSQPGNDLFLMGRDRPRLKACADDCSSRGARTTLADFDIRDLERLKAEIEKVQDEGPLDLAIFNAGVGGVSSIDRAVESIDRVQEVVEVNLLAPLIGATLVADPMAMVNGGRIVLIGSVAGQFPLPIAPSYSASKAGLAMFAEALRLRLRKHHVAVTLVSPGFIDTAMSRGLPTPRPFLISAEKAAAIIKREIDAGRSHVVLPWQFRLIGRISALLPSWAIGAILVRSHEVALRKLSD